MKKKQGRALLPGLLCALTLSFTLLVFAPVEMVVLNNSNFWFQLGDFLPFFLALAAGLAAALSLAVLAARRLPYCLYLLALGLLAGLTAMVYVQGNYLCLGSEALTAGEPVWKEMLAPMAVNTLIWAGVIVGCVALALLRPRWMMKAMPAACALILVMEGTALAALLAGARMDGDLDSVYCSDEGLLDFSTNGDVIVVMLDTFDARLMERALENDPERTDVFDGFTYYRNASSSYSLTETSFVSFLTGALCRNEDPYFVYCRKAFAESGFFPRLLDAGMTVQVYAAPERVFSEAEMKQVSNLAVRRAHVRSQAAFAKDMLCMVGYRYAPTAMQPFLIRDYLHAFSQHQAFEEGLSPESSDKNLTFYRRLTQEGVHVSGEGRYFKFYLMQGAHDPVEMNRDLEPVSGSQDRYEQLLGCFAMLGELFDQLRAADAYEQATIIVMGDHGINSGDHGICSPAVLVRYPGESGPLRTSDAPVTLLDMRATALYGAGLAYEELGTPMHQWEGVTQRDRRFMDYDYETPYSYKTYLNDITEFIVPEDAQDLEAYKMSGQEYKKP